MLLPWAKDHLTKPPILGRSSPLWSCWSGLSKRLPKCYGLLILPLVANQGWKLSSYFCWHQHALQTQGLEAPEQEGTWMPPPGGPAFIVTRRHHASFQRVTSNNSPTQLYAHEPHQWSNNAEGAVVAHTLGGNQQLSLDLRTCSAGEKSCLLLETQPASQS